MIKAQELRIGNIFQNAIVNGFNNETIFYYNTDASGKMVRSYEIKISELVPITLTAEILSKCDQYYLDKIKGLFPTMVFKDSRLCFQVNNSWYSKEYVHEFQNLYFIITGEELILNPASYRLS
ncbi:MAG: hypothetical protein ABI416_02035 [Ginsengibacter sp.]